MGASWGEETSTQPSLRKVQPAPANRVAPSMKLYWIALSAMTLSCVEDPPNEGRSVAPLSVALPEPAEAAALDRGRITVACISGQHGGLWIADNGQACSASL